jgi:uncharacterized membrane protein
MAKDQAFTAKQAATINRSKKDIYAYWRQLENLPHFVPKLRSVTQESATRSHWVADAPAGTTVEWRADITADQPGEVIAWQSTPDSEVQHEGEVRFEDLGANRGTVVRVTMTYRPPAGALGRAVAKLFGEEPEQQLHQGLLRLRQLLEVGYLVTNDGQPTGKAHPKARHANQEEARA